MQELQVIQTRFWLGFAGGGFGALLLCFVYAFLAWRKLDRTKPDALLNYVFGLYKSLMAVIAMSFIAGIVSILIYLPEYKQNPALKHIFEEL